MDPALEAVQREMQQFMEYVNRLRDFFIKDYSAGIFSAKQELALFVADPIRRPESTISVIHQFDVGTRRVHQNTHVAVNLLRSRIGNFSSNFQISSLRSDDPDPAVGRASQEILREVAEMRQEIVTHFSALADKLARLEQLLAEEIRIVEGLQTHEAFLDHLKESRHIVHIYEKEELPLYRDIVHSFIFDSSKLQRAIQHIRTYALEVLEIVKRTGRELAYDVARQPQQRQRVLAGILLTVSLCVQVYQYQELALAAAKQLAKQFSPKLPFIGWFRSLVPKLENLSPVGRRLIGTLGNNVPFPVPEFS